MYEFTSLGNVVPDVAVIVGKRQLQRLQSVVDRHRAGATRAAAERLDEVLRRAIVVPQALVPANVVAIGSDVECEDVETGERWRVIVCCPEDADDARGRISILDPLATALFGAATGECVRWTTSDGRERTARVRAVELADDWASPVAAAADPA